jgi:hypothetical protein
MSDADIYAGTRGINEIFEHLEKASFGIIVVTPGNKNASWLLFEAGALSKKLSEKTRVCPYLLGMKTSEIQPPLREFQAAVADKDGTLRLLKSINATLSLPLKEDILLKTFSHWWPDIEGTILNLLSETPSSGGGRGQSDTEMLTQILGSVLEINRRLDEGKKATDDAVKAEQWKKVLNQYFSESDTVGPLSLTSLSNLSGKALEYFAEMRSAKTAKEMEDHVEGRSAKGALKNAHQKTVAKKQ